MSTVLITGASSGIGFDFARKLLLKSAFQRIVIASVTEKEGEETKEKLRAQTQGKTTSKLSSFRCDMSSLQTVRLFADNFQKSNERVDLLVLNAGVIVGDFFEKKIAASEDGIDATFAVNYLAHWYLTELLLPHLKAAGKSRVVITSSLGHLHAKVPPGGWQAVATPGSLTCGEAYMCSKLANATHVFELQRRYQAWGLTANAIHPGNIRQTNIWARQGARGRFFFDGLVFGLGRLLPGSTQSVDQGSGALLAAAEAAHGGGYLSVERGGARWVEASPAARDPAAAAALWALSEALVREKLGDDALGGGR